ncbi:TetR/AcrR family transcriptional regulator [Candidatus Mycobacterium wuenschmannii]|uniref:TetR/AcrR family transcriptional regulator n=1 Tax=Candidatus Mycobacterium wuenschmannii TaxID=3027808 RepID=A0ABY8VUC5_9MYCO|nr:TetR/AcrR family transcriptional regulator [Candidatus Mycobacterium wuenschmannii]WIM85748.1 TetR/AcrR family transcriptional regulator [Candidatus Mycobacterium wuenschmannii]
MSETSDTRADSTRQQILRAAARQFARLPYHQVGLDDVLAEAELTKGAMYFHFRSKHALALAIIEDQITRSDETIADLLARKLSGLETLIDFSYQLAVRDIGEDISRAALHLVESIGRVEGLQTKLHRHWIDNLTVAVRRGIGEGDVLEQCEPEDVGRLVASSYMGLRQTADLDEPGLFLTDFEKMWALMLPGFVRPERVDYFRQFIKRRTKLAIGSTSTLAGSN